MRSEVAIVNGFNGMAEKPSGATIEVKQIGSVSIAIRVVLHRTTLRKVRREVPSVFHVGKPASTNAHADDAEQQRRGHVSVIFEDSTEGDHPQQVQDEDAPIYGSSFGWVTFLNETARFVNRA